MNSKIKTVLICLALLCTASVVASYMRSIAFAQSLYERLRSATTSAEQASAINQIYDYRITSWWSPKLYLDTCDEHGEIWMSGEVSGRVVPDSSLNKAPFVFKLLYPGAVNAIYHMKVQ